jgi:choline dehydrogenase
MDDCDYLIIGGGTAGCVLANRLSGSAENRVVLLEAGGLDRNIWLHIPMGYAKVHMRPKFNWLYPTEPEGELGGRAATIPRGKVLGGSGAVNGLVYIRGQREDYDRWRDLGNPGWGYNDVLPYFRKSEHQSRGSDEFHGSDGLMGVSDPRQSDELSEAFIRAAVQAGIPRNDDFNGAQQEGVGYFQSTSKNGWRHSTSTAFIKPVRHRPNLRVILNAHVEKILLKGKCALGVRYRVADKAFEMRASREVISAAGAIASPQLLQVSGIGPGAVLQAHDVQVVHDLPGVGRSLQDHFNVQMAFRCKQRVTLNDKMASLAGRVGIALRYALSRSGPLSYSAASVGAFVRTSRSLSLPDVEIMLLLFSRSQKITEIDKFSGFTIVTTQLRPESRGSVEIRSPDITTAPRIQFNYLNEPADRRAIANGLGKIRDIMMSPAFESYYGGGIAIDPCRATNEELLAHARAKGGSNQHACCSCRMGVDELAVVNSRLQVRGIDRLRVADASVMPTITSGHTNAPTIMIAEKAADMILGGT